MCLAFPAPISWPASLLSCSRLLKNTFGESIWEYPSTLIVRWPTLKIICLNGLQTSLHCATVRHVFMCDLFLPRRRPLVCSRSIGLGPLVPFQQALYVLTDGWCNFLIDLICILHVYPVISFSWWSRWTWISQCNCGADVDTNGYNLYFLFCY
jgi:hypothetical protein